MPDDTATIHIEGLERLVKQLSKAPKLVRKVQSSGRAMTRAALRETLNGYLGF